MNYSLLASWLRKFIIFVCISILSLCLLSFPSSAAWRASRSLSNASDALRLPRRLIGIFKNALRGKNHCHSCWINNFSFLLTSNLVSCTGNWCATTLDIVLRCGWGNSRQWSHERFLPNQTFHCLKNIRNVVKVTEMENSKTFFELVIFSKQLRWNCYLKNGLI